MDIFGHGLVPEDVIPFMLLPTLNSFGVSVYYGGGAIRWDEDNKGPSGDPEGDFQDMMTSFQSMRFVKRSLKLTKLEFIHTSLDFKLLDGILQTPEALDTLVYDSLGTEDLRLGIDLPIFARALRHQIHSLTTLALTRTDNEHDIRDVEPMGSLSDFTLLTTLIIPCLCLFGGPDAIDDGPRDCANFFDLLPSGLVYLTIEIGEDWSIDKFLNVAGGENVSRWKRERAEKVPHLKTFTYRVTGYRLPQPEDGNLVGKLEALGIEELTQDNFPWSFKHFKVAGFRYHP